MRTASAAAAVVALVLALSGCATDASSDASPGPEPGSGAALRIATTVAPITSLVATIGGERVEVTGIVPEGVNSHTFEPAPSVAELLANVDALVLNGLQLEEPTRELAAVNLPAGAPMIALGDLAITAEEWVFDFSFPAAEGKPNPHLWTDPTLVVAYAEQIATALVELDPDGAAVYEANLAGYLTQVDAFEAAMLAAFETIPEDNKRLLTYHDSFAYFARTYDWEVLGAIQVADFGDPTPRELAGLIDQVRETGVPAIFGSEVFPSPVLEQIGAEADVRYVDELRDDDLPGEPGEPEHSLLGLLRFDFRTITEALGGDPSALDEFELVVVTPDTAEYPT